MSLLSLLAIFARFFLLVLVAADAAIQFVSLVSLFTFTNFIYGVAGRLIFLSNLSGLYNPQRSVRCQASSMFFYSQIIFPITCIYFLVLDSAALLGVGWRCGFFSILLQAVTNTVGIWTVDFLEGVPPLENCFTISILLNILKFSLQAFFSTSHPGR